MIRDSIAGGRQDLAAAHDESKSLDFNPLKAPASITKLVDIRSVLIINRSLPDVPNTAKTGFPDVILSNWWSWTAPKGTDPGIINKLSAAIAEVLKTPATRNFLIKPGFIPAAMTPSEFSRQLQVEAAIWKKIPAQSGIKMA